MCQPGRPAPHGDGQDGSPGLAVFQSAKSSGARLLLADDHAGAGLQLVERLVRRA